MGEETAKSQASRLGRQLHRPLPINEELFAHAPSRLCSAQPWDSAKSRPGVGHALRPRVGDALPAADVPSPAELLPILQPKRTGLARLAEQAEPVEEGHLVEFRALTVRSILNKSVSKRKLWFARTINPYRGCEFACRYCYARYTHEFLELRDPEAFERQIFIKQNAAWLLEQELRGLDPEEEIAIGTATDPYQPVERRAQVTRSILEVLARRGGHRIGIVTKSTLIERDIALLQQIAANNELVLHITITTPDAALARLLEPRAPRPDLRFRTVSRLREAGLRTGILCSPLLPGLTDTLPALDAMAERARAANASFFSAQPLFLKPCWRGVFLSFLQQHYPELEANYAARYDADAFVSRAYAERIRGLVRAVTRKHGLKSRMTDAILTRNAGQAPTRPVSAQATLWPGARQQLISARRAG